MIILQLGLFIGFVGGYLGFCVRLIVRMVCEPAVAVSWTQGPPLRQGVAVTPGDDVIGSGDDPLAWGVLDDHQLRRLLKGSP